MRINPKTYGRNRRRIVADEEIEVDETLDVKDDVDVDVAPEAAELLFEAEDVAELVAEITGSPVEVTAEDESVTFEVDGEAYTVEPEGDEEILESSRRVFRGKRPVKASRALRTARSRRPIKASRRVPAKRR